MTKKTREKKTPGATRTRDGLPPKRGPLSRRWVSGARQNLTHTHNCAGDIMGTAAESTSGEVGSSSLATSSSMSIEHRGFNHCFHRIVRRNDESPPATAWLRQRAVTLPSKLCRPDDNPYKSGEHQREHTTTSLTLRNSNFLR